MTEQDEIPLFPLRIASYVPSPWPSADLKELARTGDGHDFAAKWEHEGVGLPASEWLGHKLARACQVATPFTATLTDHHGNLGFGSRIEGGVSSFSSMAASEKLEVVSDCSQAMSGLLGLDMFIGNEDRHLNNWLFRRNLAGRWAPLCIDFSRALFRRGFPADTWPLPPCNTTATISLLRSLSRWDGAVAVFAVEQLQSVSVAVLEHWLAECPPQWLAPPGRVALVAWWASPAYHARLQATYALL